MTTALAKTIQPDEWAMIQMMSMTIFESHAFPGVSSPATAAVLLLTARDLGIPYSAALQGIDMINGKPSVRPALVWAIIRASGLLESFTVKDHTDAKGIPTACTVTLTRKGDQPYSVTVTMEDAQRAGLVKPNSGWTSWPANMLRARALGFVEDIVFPDLLYGIKRSDEYGADEAARELVIEEAA